MMVLAFLLALLGIAAAAAGAGAAVARGRMHRALRLAEAPSESGPPPDALAGEPLPDARRRLRRRSPARHTYDLMIGRTFFH